MSFDPRGIVSRKRKWSYASGWTGEIIVCLKQEDVASCIEANWNSTYPEVAGDDDSAAGPDAPLSVIDIAEEAWMEGDVVQSDADSKDGTGGLTNNRKLTFTFGLTYLKVPWPDAYKQPYYAPGTTLKLDIKNSGQFLTIPARCFQIKGFSSTMPQGMDGRLYIPLTDFNIEWDRVTDLGSLDFTPYVGKVNQNTFMSCEPETLLLEAANATPSFILDPINGPWAWKVTCCFKRRRIVLPNTYWNSGGPPTNATLVDDGDTHVAVMGWNHEFREQPIPGWQYVLMASQPNSPTSPRYTQYDFTDIFNESANDDEPAALGSAFKWPLS
jgi:hypothetical protein